MEKIWSMYLWHRYAGLLAAFFLVYLAVTGILLNHAHEIGLDQRYVSNRLLLNIYNIEPLNEIRGFNLAGKWLTKHNRIIYLDEQAIAQSDGQLVAALLTADAMIVVVQQELLLFDPEGILIERISNPSPLSAPVSAAGLTNDDALVIAAGGRMFIADADLLSWSKADSENFDSIKLATLPRNLQAKLSEKFLFTTLTWERVLQDAHAGRIAGNSGRLFVDLMGLLLILLAVTGIIIWLQRLAAQRQRDQED